MMITYPADYKLMVRYHDKQCIYLYVFGHAKVIMSEKYLKNMNFKIWTFSENKPLSSHLFIRLWKNPLA